MYKDIRQGNNGVVGFLETFKVYRYLNSGYVDVLVGVSIDSKRVVKPLIYRGGDMLDMVEANAPIDGYIKAKKPIYSSLNSDVIWMKVRAQYDYATNEVTGDYTYEVYKPFKLGEVEPTGHNKALCTTINKTNDALDELACAVVDVLAVSKLDRAEFLKERCKDE